MDKPKVSVIVPVYNVEKYLHRCIGSILSQTYTDFELLLVDDGSTDGSGKICDEYAQKDSRIRVFHKENGGVSSARNFGLEKSVGIFITFCDSDDFVNQDYLESLVGNENFDLSGVSMHTISGFSNWMLPDLIYNDSKPIIDIILNNSDDCFRRVAAKLFRSKIIKEYNIHFSNDIKWGEDTLFMLDYLKHCNSIFFSSLPLYCYDFNDNSLTHCRTYIDEIKLIKEFINRIWEFKIKEFEKYALARKFSYYHFECILKYNIYNNNNWNEIRAKLHLLIKEPSVQIIISSKIKNKGLRSRLLDLFLRNNILDIAIGYAKILNIIGKPLY